MKSLLTLIAIAFGYPLGGQAGPIPCSGSIAALFLQGGCSAGSISLTNFDISASNGILIPFSQFANNDDVNISVSQNGGSFDVAVTSIPPINWSLGPNQELSFVVQYMVSAPAGSFSSIQGILSSAQTGNASDQAIIGVCNIAFNPNSTCNNPLITTVLLSDTNGTLTDGPLPLHASQGVFFISEYIQIAGSGATAQLNSVTTRFNTSATPEPATTGLTALGLLAAALYRSSTERSRRSRLR